jgi:hypothetical protein
MGRRREHPRPSRARETIYTMRVGEGERRIWEAAARQRGEYLSEYLRRVATEEAIREGVGAP